MKPFHNPLQIMLEPVRHQKRFAVGSFDDVLQCIQLAIMDKDCISGIIINCAVRHLGQLAGKRSGVCGTDLSVGQVQYELLFHFLIGIPLVLT